MKRPDIRKEVFLKPNKCNAAASLFAGSFSYLLTQATREKAGSGKGELL